MTPLTCEVVFAQAAASASSSSRHRPRTGPLICAPRGALETGVQALTLLTDRRLEWDVARYSRDVELILLPTANRMRVQPIDFDHSRRLIREALTAAREFLARRDTPVTARVAA